MELAKASIIKIDPDIILIKYKEGAKISETDAREIDEAQLTMCQGNDVFIIADLLNGNPEIDKLAEDYYVNKGRMIPFTKGIAIVAKTKSSLFSRLFGKTTRTLYPTKEFASVDEAKAWLSSIRG
ncbi:hypothetical protein K6119_08700 [Paracrocinitomix mangrovi]|uniref:DUF7793 family protein n=1 Tax=Paracrocinitomix mangrovi TaxID=2862509 RepID=UPI001C8E7C13|nr:hypothetical protein [Paracrocinitomix mangrovi]UKN03591.1 hypothetical protein K6119_08700 [Paracrocinitomix mangrovi]